jgi:multiple sugar transport system substrate-binding protein
MKSRREFLLSASALALAGCVGKEPDHDEQGRLIVSIWHPWGGTRTAPIERILHAYEKANPHVKLRIVFTPNDLSNNQKFFTSVAAAKPPDVIFVDGPQVAEWAERGALQPLDKWVNAAGIRAEDYWTPCWKENLYRSQVWAMTFCADPNFAFAWNKKDFRDVGLDPERPPQTIDELDEYAAKLTKIENGKITRLGILPWDQYGKTNSLFTWGWVFGGSFYDEVTHKITANHPKVLRALEWMLSYAQKYDVTRVMAHRQGFGTAALDAFYVGQLSMKTLVLSGLDDLRKYAPNLEYGLSFIPAPPDGEQHSSWVGGWCIGVPSGARHPEEGWKLVRWMCATDDGTEMAGREMGLFPGYRRSPAFKSLIELPGFEQYYQILKESRHQRPVMPVQGYYMGALDRAVDATIYGKKTPRQALDDATAETQAELDVVLRGG